MSRAPRSRQLRSGQALGGIGLLEQSVILFSLAPARAKFEYLAGAAPFFAGLIYFWITMSRSRLAAESVGVSALMLALLFSWKNITDSWYARRLETYLEAEPEATAIDWMGAVRNVAWQPLSLYVLPLAALVSVPFAWAFAFFRNLSLTAAAGVSDPVRRAWRASMRDTKQNWTFLLVLSLAALLLYVNLLALVIMTPQLLRSFFGWETGLAQMGVLLLNRTTLGMLAILTYLALDPLITAAYVIRCFGGEARESGIDLRAALRRIPMAIWLAIALPPSLWPADPVNAIDPARLERRAAEVLRRDEFSWQIQTPAAPAPGWWTQVTSLLERSIKWLGDLFDKWFGKPKEPRLGDDELGWFARNTDWILLLLAAVFLAVIVVLWMRRRRAPATAAATAAATPVVDVADERTSADALPESEWIRLAESLITQGDFRLALRALYLASLRYLSERRLVTIQFWKSGAEYRQELARRARATPQVEMVFAGNNLVFERVWYGRDGADAEMVRAFAARLEEMRKHAEAQ